MLRIKIIATLVVATITSIPVFAQIKLPNVPTDTGITLDVQHLKPLAMSYLKSLSATVVTVLGDSGSSGHDVSFLVNDMGKNLGLSSAEFILDLTQFDDIQLSNDVNSITDVFQLDQLGNKTIFYVKKNAGTLTNRGELDASAVAVWFGPMSSTRELNNLGIIVSDKLTAVAVEGSLDALDNSGSLYGNDAGVYITPVGIIGKLNNTGDIAATGSGYAIYNEGVIKDIVGSGTFEGGIYNAGTIVLNNGNTINSDLNNNGTLVMSDHALVTTTLQGNLTNSGRIVLNPTSRSAGNSLIINGNYTGTVDSILSLSSVLAGDNSLTDRLVVTGDTNGESTLNITNENGVGGQTLEGLQLVSVGGNSNAIFRQGSRIVAGVYDYTLRKGNTSGTDNKGWYLTSYATPDNTSIPMTNLTPAITGTTSVPMTTLLPATGITMHMVRPEAASYSANLLAANTMFNLSLHDRASETLYQDALTTSKVGTTSLWLRNEGGRNTFSLSDGQNKTAANRYVMQVGGNVLNVSANDNDRYDLGVMAGYASQYSSAHNNLTGHDSKGSVHGYSIGFNGTWYQNIADNNGLHIDSWLQYGWFNNEVKGQDLPPETYKSQGLMTSLETGYALCLAVWKSAENTDNAFFVEPNAQIVWMGVKADEHEEDNGTQVSGYGDNNVQTKLSLRTYLNSKSVLNKDTIREFQPFVDVRWIHNTQQTGVSMNGVTEHVIGARNVGELKAGVEERLSRSLSAWMDAAQQIGTAGYSDTEGELGIEYQF